MIFYAFSVIIFGLCIAKELPLPLTTCKRNTVDYSTCLIHAAQESWSKIVKGFPEINFPPLDPLLFDHFDFKYDNDMIHAVMSMSNITVNALEKICFLAVRPHFLKDAFHLEVDVFIPKEDASVDFKTEIRLGTIRISNEGYVDVSRNNIKATWNITGYVKHDIWTVTHFSITSLTNEDIQIHFYNLFDKTITMIINNFLTDFMTQYGNTIIKAMLPLENALLESLIIDLINILFSKVPFSKVFP